MGSEMCIRDSLSTQLIEFSIVIQTTLGIDFEIIIHVTK